MRAQRPAPASYGVAGLLCRTLSVAQRLPPATGASKETTGAAAATALVAMALVSSALVDGRSGSRPCEADPGVPGAMHILAVAAKCLAATQT